MAMSLALQFKSSTNVPVSVRGILPEKIAGLSTRQVAKLPIWLGNRQLPLGDLFDVRSIAAESTSSPEDDNQDIEPVDNIVWHGDLSSVHWLGAEMQSGRMLVEGNLGRHLGSQMAGGEIVVTGSVGDWAGCEMSGGRIDIGNNAGDWLGAAYPGTKSGTDRGVITVGGDAGSGVGFALRRGWICVAGSVQRLAGWNMLAGTIVVGRSAGPMAGKGMVRGSLVLPSREHADGNRSALPPSFLTGAVFNQPVIGMTRNWLKKLAVDIDIPTDCEFQLFHGDQLAGGRGEILIAAKAKKSV